MLSILCFTVPISKDSVSQTWLHVRNTWRAFQPTKAKVAPHTNYIRMSRDRSLTSCQCRRDKRFGLIPGSGKSPGKGNGNPFQYSRLEHPMDRGACWATIHGVAQSRPLLKQLSTRTHDLGIMTSSYWFFFFSFLKFSLYYVHLLACVHLLDCSSLCSSSRLSCLSRSCFSLGFRTFHL